MNILTTIHHGLADDCPRHLAELSRNRARIAAWQQRKAHQRKPQGGFIEEALALLGLMTFVGVSTVAIHTLTGVEAQPPEPCKQTWHRDEAGVSRFGCPEESNG